MSATEYFLGATVFFLAAMVMRGCMALRQQLQRRQTPKQDDCSS